MPASVISTDAFAVGLPGTSRPGEADASLSVASVLSTQKPRLRFLGRPSLPGEISSERRTRITIRDAIRAGAVPDLWYELDSGCRISVSITGHACRALRACCAESNVHGREVGGILVGYRCGRLAKAGLQHRLSLTDLIAIESQDSSSAHICFGERAWIRAEREFGEKYRPEGKCRLGWYHTHPRQGIFFSAQDRDAHRLFQKPHEFALVVDPQVMQAGLFYWSDQRKQVLAGPICFSLPGGKE
jgi:proteasome lid subunit RPN8/RPN11